MYHIIDIPCQATQNHLFLYNNHQNAIRTAIGDAGGDLLLCNIPCQPTPKNICFSIITKVKSRTWHCAIIRGSQSHKSCVPHACMSKEGKVHEKMMNPTFFSPTFTHSARANPVTPNLPLPRVLPFQPNRNQPPNSNSSTQVTS
jgi:hypothetical protein